MEKKVLNYRVIIEPEKMGRKTVYNAYCPTLGVADYGDSVDEVLESIKDGIKLAIECLIEELEKFYNRLAENLGRKPEDESERLQT